MGDRTLSWGLPRIAGDNPGDSEIPLDLGKRVRECVSQANDNGASGSRHHPAGCGGSIEAREGSCRPKLAYGRWTRYSERIECFDVRSDRTDERPSGRAADRERRERVTFGSGANGAPHGRALRGTDGLQRKPTGTEPLGAKETKVEAAGPERPSGRDGAGSEATGSDPLGGMGRGGGAAGPHGMAPE